MNYRRRTRPVRAGSLIIGGDASVSVQSMTNLPVADVEGTVRQIALMKERGADLVRLALMTVDDAAYLETIIARTGLPLCADIHFDYRIALAALRAGIHKVRINPGNIGSAERTREVVREAKERGVPVRIGVNGGSIDRTKYKNPTPDALVDSALSHVKILEDFDFTDIVVSIKASDVAATVEANRIFAEKNDYPLHIGLTEAGYGLSCVVQSSVAIGSLLLDGIGDTIRVSRTGDPVEEIGIAHEILSTAGRMDHGVKIIACPTCGRTDPTIDLESIAREIDCEARKQHGDTLRIRKRILSIAVMGCEVNGPGEASHADIGIAGARGGNFILFKGGECIGKYPEREAVRRLLDEIGSVLL
jgi:(E)-4-hydroxy-3-methylbut-2-enyl-diphosphate synthase